MSWIDLREGSEEESEHLELLRFLLKNGRLARSAKQTLQLIVKYYAETGNETFTYRQLRAWWDHRQLWRQTEWHTIERAIRLLAEYGYLERAGSGKRVVFEIPAWLIEEMGG